MAQSRTSTLRKIFGHSPAQGVILPPEARVDPDRFPEEAFPLYCTGCGYLLRGLLGDRCPECGRTFDRGRLLVEQYVIRQGAPQEQQASLWVKRTGVTGIILGMGFPILIGGPAWLGQSTVVPLATMSRLATLGMILSAAGGVLLLISAVLSFRVAYRGRNQARQVLEAIPRDTPEFVAAQKRKWLLWLVCLGPMALLFTWQIWSDRDVFTYYGKAPARLLIPPAIALVVGVFLVVGYRLWNRDPGKLDDGDQ